MDTNARLARLETSFEHMQSDLREIKAELRGTKWWVIGSAIGSVAVIIAVVFGLGSWIQFGMTQITDRMDRIETKMDQREAEWREKEDRHNAEWKEMLKELSSQDKRISKIEAK
ncbi:MAG: hypothetical protein IK079_03930 [Desulfovibrio sp.]|nr:hypothetical protein [Desulfovibrio sp.]